MPPAVDIYTTTGWALASEWENIKLDQHNVDCGGNGYALTGFAVKTQYNPNRLTIDYSCRALSVVGEVLEDSTPQAPDGGMNGGVIYLDRHDKLACPSGYVLQQWRVTRPTNYDIKINYRCASTGVGTCEIVSTDWKGTGGINYLDQHGKSCGDGRVMAGWNLQTRIENNIRQIRLNLKCCSLLPTGELGTL